METLYPWNVCYMLFPTLCAQILQIEVNIGENFQQTWQ